MKGSYFYTFYQMHTYVRSENNIYSHPQMKKLRQKHIGINSVLGSQILHVMTFDVDTSQGHKV